MPSIYSILFIVIKIVIFTITITSPILIGSTEIETTTREIVSPDGDFSGLTYKASNNNQDLSVAFYEGKTDDEVNYCLDQGDKFYFLHTYHHP